MWVCALKLHAGHLDNTLDGKSQPGGRAQVHGTLKLCRLLGTVLDNLLICRWGNGAQRVDETCSKSPSKLVAELGVDSRSSASGRASLLCTKRCNFKWHHILDARAQPRGHWSPWQSTGANIPLLHFLNHHVQETSLPSMLAMIIFFSLNVRSLLF